MDCPDVVLIEDDDDIRGSLEDLLTAEGYRVHAFPNGRAAIEGLKKMTQPCLILLDWMMPVMSGPEFLKAREGMGDAILSIPILVVSAVADHAKKAGVPYIKKPVDLDVLLKLVRSHCTPEHPPKS